MKTENNKNPVLAGIVSGGISALIVSLLFFQFAKDGLNTSVLDATTDRSPETILDSTKDFISQEELVIAAVKEAKPAVVSVIITQDVPIIEQYYEKNDPFGGFFGPMPQYRENG